MIFLVYSIVSLFNCVFVLFALHDVHCTCVAQCSPFVLKVPLNNNKARKAWQCRWPFILLRLNTALYPVLVSVQWT